MKMREEEVDWLPLVKETAEWMEEKGAIHDNEEKTRGHIVRVEWADNFGVTYGVDSDDWTYCLVKMFKAGYIVGCDPGRGFYLANPADGPTSVTRLINYVTTLCTTIDKLLDSMATGGNWEDMLPGFKGRLRIGEVDNVIKLLEGAQVDVQKEVRTALLEAKKQFQVEGPKGTKVG